MRLHRVSVFLFFAGVCVCVLAFHLKRVSRFGAAMGHRGRCFAYIKKERGRSVRGKTFKGFVPS